MPRLMDALDRLEVLLKAAAAAGTIPLPGGVVQYIPVDMVGMDYPFVALGISDEDPEDGPKQNWSGTIRLGCYVTYADASKLQRVTVEMTHKIIRVIGANGNWTHAGVTMLPGKITYSSIRRDSGPVGHSLFELHCKYKEAAG